MLSLRVLAPSAMALGLNAAPLRCITPTMSTTAIDTSEAAKAKILQIAALTDRGQRLNKLVAPTYQEYREDMAELVEQLSSSTRWTASEAALSGEWELILSDVELFRSSPFFLAIEEALNNSPGIPKLGRWLGVTDPTKKAETFFKLHQLQVLSSLVGHEHSRPHRAGAIWMWGMRRVKVYRAYNAAAATP